LKDMAAKVKRGQRGRLEAGLAPAGICYGYRPIHELDARGEVSRGKREIIGEHAEIIQRIFEEYAIGLSPRAIAKRLNMEGIPSPRGGQWVASAINRSRARKSGILHNELYVGHMTYNRQTFRKDPDTGRRIPRVNPQSEWKTVAVPELRIVSDEIWTRVHAVKYQKGKNAPVHKTRRPKHLFSGLVRCGECGGGYSVNGGSNLRCSRRRESGTCENGRVVSVKILETRILQGFQRQLLSEKAFQHFVKTFNEERVKIRAQMNKAHGNREKELAEANRRIKQIVKAVGDGLDSKTMRAELMELERRAEQFELDQKVAKATPVNVIDLHPQLPAIYERKVKALREALTKGDSARTEAIEALRGMITDITVKPGPKRGETLLELNGSIPAVLAFASATEGSNHEHTVIVVAAEGFEPPTKGL
jgi:site-specific DNA recombinase